MRLNKEVLNKLTGKLHLLSSRMVADCKFCYALLQNDQHAIDQKYVCSRNRYA